MSFNVVKFFDPLTQPMGILWLLLLVGALRSLMKARLRTALFFVLLAAALNIIGNTSLPGMWLASLERPYANADLTKIPECDAVVMLGGTHYASSYDAFGIGLGEGADRIVMAVELMRLGKGRTLLLGGGAVERNGRPEAELIQRWIGEWKLITAPVQNLGICHNTYEEAIQVQKLSKERKWKRVVLVSSAYHLRRAEAVFRNAGVTTIPVGCDFQGLNFLEVRRPFTIFPRLHGFALASLYCHEQIGWCYYRLRGWINAEPPPTN